MRKYQQGGVFDVNPVVPQIGGIPGSPNIQQPTVAPSSLPDVLSLVRDSESRRRYEEQRILREQNLLDSTQSQFFELRDPVFGELHNKQQMDVASKVRKKYGVSDNVNFDINNIYALKTQINNLRLAARDPEMMKVFGEVEAAKKFREIASRPGSMTSDEVIGFNTAWEQYQQHEGQEPFDVNRLLPSLYNQPKPPNQTDFAVTTRQTMANNLGLDVTTDQGRAVLFDNVANAWYSRNGKGAEELGYITIDPNTQFPVLTPLGQQTALNQYQGLQSTFQYKQEQAIDKSQQIADYRDNISDGNRDPNTDSEGGTAWETFIELYPQFSVLDPKDPKVQARFSQAVDDKKLTTTAERRAGAVTDLTTLLPTPPTAAEEQARIRALPMDAFGFPSGTVQYGQTTVAPVTTTVKKKRTLAD